MTKLLWHSNAPFVPTGYGQQTALFTRRLRDLGHDVAISANFGLAGSSLDWEGMHLYPMDEQWGKKWLAACAAHHSETGDPTDVQIITLMDVWVVITRMWSRLHVASWVPVDHSPTPPLVREFFNVTGATPIAMSRYGERMLQDAGFEPLYVPHGVETDVYAEIPDRRAMRGLIGLPADAFVVGMVAANKGNAPPRKAFPQTFAAFAELRRKHSDAMLYLHTDVEAGRDGVNLSALLDHCGVPTEAVKLTPPFELYNGVSPERMAYVYSSFDVLASPSYGEGFGIPIVEAQACGTPAIVNDFSAMSELTGPGWAVTGEPWYDCSQGADFQCPSIASIYEAMEDAYASAESKRAAAREFALQYDADTVARDHWVPALAQLDAKRAESFELPEVPKVKLNRGMRRALA